MVRITNLTALSVIAIGFGVPVALVYFSVYHQFNWIAATILGFVALVVAAGLGIIGMAIGSEELPETVSSADTEKLNLLRAHQRATLEELDEITAVLKQIRDILKTAGQ